MDTKNPGKRRTLPSHNPCKLLSPWQIPAQATYAGLLGTQLRDVGQHGISHETTERDLASERRKRSRTRGVGEPALSGTTDVF